MELHQAVKHLIKEYGISILLTKRLLYLLDDFQAFENDRTYKAVLKTLINDGYLNGLLDIYNSGSNRDNEIHKYIQSIHLNTGLSQKILYSIINELQIGLGFSKIDIPNEEVENGNSTSKDKLYAGGIDMDAPMKDIAMQFVNMGYSVKLMSTTRIDLIGVFSGIDNTTIRIEGTLDGTTTSISALLPLSFPSRDIAITRAMANQFTNANGLPEVGNDFFDSCKIIDNIIVNTTDTSVPPFFSRWILKRGTAIIAYTPFNIEFSVIKND